MQHDDVTFMRVALEQADEARRKGEIPVGAVVTLDGEIVGLGHNLSITTVDPTAHAEIVALRDAARTVGNYRLVGSRLYCTVEPCLMCLGAAMHSRVGRVIYGAADPKIRATEKLEAMRSRGAGFNHRFEVEGGVLADEAAGLLQEFFRERRPTAGEAIGIGPERSDER